MGSPEHARGEGLAILVNANAKRGGRRIAAELARTLPAAHVRLTKSIEEVESWIRSLRAPSCLLAAGGDGTAQALVNALDHVIPSAHPFPLVGILPLGTGNAWAHASGATKLDRAVKLLQRYKGRLPARRFTLLRCEGTLTTFAGCGWDAQLINDYKEQLDVAGPSKPFAKSVYGYLTALFFRTVPKSILSARPHVIVENMGEEVYTMTADRKILKVSGYGHGSILYDGPMSVSGAATCPEYGYGFKAFPHAERIPGLMSVRVYDRETLRAVKDIPRLWRGEHPLKGMHDWFASKVRMTFSRPLPVEIGGDAAGHRHSIEYEVSPRSVNVLDWRGMGL